jgi:hypothetical protein
MFAAARRVVEHMLVTAGRALVGRLSEETEIGAGSAARWVSDVPHAPLSSSPVTRPSPFAASLSSS